MLFETEDIVLPGINFSHDVFECISERIGLDPLTLNEKQTRLLAMDLTEYLLQEADDDENSKWLIAPVRKALNEAKDLIAINQWDSAKFCYWTMLFELFGFLSEKQEIQKIAFAAVGAFDVKPYINNFVFWRTDLAKWKTTLLILSEKYRDGYAANDHLEFCDPTERIKGGGVVYGYPRKFIDPDNPKDLP